ncbi:MAG: hypothetical protein ABEJ56_05770 [Candidatus Nanohaloarchaea archaeon]
MVVGKKEKGDIELDTRAKKIKAQGKIYRPRKARGYKVYSDTNDRKRRDVFVPGKMKEDFGKDLPDTAKVFWNGQYRKAKLSFRRGKGRNILVYQFRVSSRAQK